jgi:hypothetical protein
MGRHILVRLSLPCCDGVILPLTPHLGDTNNYSQHGPPMDSKTRAYLEQLGS